MADNAKNNFIKTAYNKIELELELIQKDAQINTIDPSHIEEIINNLKVKFNETNYLRFLKNI